ncbi:hypothetical protein HDU96_002902 [Phlyctochytrium bullatum]|nr:hypothetical protein HDU96_002902 [Phlyctochytrium bullatum]
MSSTPVTLFVASHATNKPLPPAATHWKIESITQVRASAAHQDAFPALAGSNATRLTIQPFSPSSPSQAGPPTDRAWHLIGVSSNVRYAKRSELTDLAAKQAGLGRPQATRASLIPIRKNPAWWALSQDERRSVFEEVSHHNAIGMEYLPQIARKLYHCRDLRGLMADDSDQKATAYDFLTWFEFAPEDEACFDELLRRLRQSKEWDFVEDEVDIRLSRVVATVNPEYKPLQSIPFQGILTSLLLTMKLAIAALALALYLGLATTVAATPLPQLQSTDDVDLDISDNGVLPDLSLSRAIELAHDASDDTMASNDYAENNDNLPNDDRDLENFGMSRAQTLNGVKFDFNPTDYGKYAFISTVIRTDDDWTNAETYFKRECDDKFPAKQGDNRNSLCKNKAWDWNKKHVGVFALSYPEVKLHWLVTKLEGCEQPSSFAMASLEWCEKAFGGPSMYGMESFDHYNLCRDRFRKNRQACRTQMRKTNIKNNKFERYFWPLDIALQ